MKLGVVGASGTLGRVSVQQLLESSDVSHVNALVRRADEGLAALKGCHSYVGGIFDDGKLERFAEDSDVIVNLAARNPEGDAADRENFRDFFLVNGVGAATVAAAAARHGRPLLHFSSVAVYEADTVSRDSAVREQDALPAGDPDVCDYFGELQALLSEHYRESGSGQGSLPAVRLLQDFLESKPLPAAVPIYGLSKLLGEVLARRNAGKVCAVRMSDVYGPGHESRGVVTDHLNALRANDHVVVDFDFRSSVYFVYIDDVSRLIAEVAGGFLQNSDVPEIVNFVGDRLDEGRFADMLSSLETTKPSPSMSIGPADSTSKVDRRYDGTVFKTSFPHFDMTSFERGLAATWANTQR